MNKYQFVNHWPEWQGFGLYHSKKVHPPHSVMAQIYKWYLYLGFWEIRRWTNYIIKLDNKRSRTDGASR